MINKGTLITAAIRPNDSNDLIASAFGNEIKGSHHSYATLTERNDIIESRREWGMLCTIYNDTTQTNNLTYQLKYNQVDTDINNNNNWVIYTPSGRDTSKWIDNVQELSNVPTTFINGYRYLVGNNGNGVFSGQNNKIAIWNNNSGTFSFVEPNNGQTLRVDSIDNVLFKYEGTFSSGMWVREYLNQVRYLSLNSNDGLTYSALSISQNPIDTYSFSVYYCNFNMTSSGTVSISIDNLPLLEVKKLQNNSFSSLVSGDIVPNINYQLVLNDSGFFQTVLPNTTTTTIGVAESGGYTDGLFTDFTTTTPIGTAVDRFNELFKFLVPPSAPNLNSLTVTGSFVNGGVSFDNNTGGFVGATGSTYGAVNRGGTFSSSDSPFRLGITSRVIQPITGNQFFRDITGILNGPVPISTQTPFPAYVTSSFGNGNLGTISLYLNSVTVSSIGLTSGLAVDTTSSGATSGINLSSATSSLFPTGFPFDTFKNRTGTFTIKRDNPNIVEGYNFLEVRHDTPSTSYLLNRYEWIADGSTASVSFLNPRITLQNGDTKFISGIPFYKTLQLTYQTTLNNFYSNTFNINSNSIQFRDVSNQLTLTSNPVFSFFEGLTSSSTSSNIFSPLFSSINPQRVSVLPNNTIPITMTYSLLPNVRRINDNIGFAMTVLKTVQGTFSGGTSSASNDPVTKWFIDSYTSSSTPLVENFDDEDYRINNGSAKFNTYHTVSSISGNDWDPQQSLIENNGLQIINGVLIYPKFNFQSEADSTRRSNELLYTNTDYSGCVSVENGFGTSSTSQPTNYRTYTRRFLFTSASNFFRFRLNIEFNISTFFVNSTMPLGSNGVWVEMKLPYFTGNPPAGTQSGGSVTGWMDATKPFITGRYSDGDGCLEGTLPTSSGGNWIINFGAQGTQFSGGNILFRITAGPSWNGHISRVQITPS